MSSFDCCHGCKERWIDIEHGTRCHASCERYLEKKAEHEQKKEAYKASLEPVLHHGSFLGDSAFSSSKKKR